jgi:hypothetical protein
MAGDPAAIARCSRSLGPDVDAREWLGDYRRFGAACGYWLLQVTSLLQIGHPTRPLFSEW